MHIGNREACRKRGSKEMNSSTYFPPRKDQSPAHSHAKGDSQKAPALCLSWPSGLLAPSSSSQQTALGLDPATCAHTARKL